jgi:hypothetical protein
MERPGKWLTGIVLIVWLQVPNGAPSEAEAQGKAAGEALLEALRLQAEMRVWEPECDPLKRAPEHRDLCAALNRFSDMFMDLDEPRRGRRLEEWSGFHLLETLTQGFESRDPFMRFQILAQLEFFCRDKMLGELHLACSRTEELALRILNADSDPLNRHFALEVLAQGRATSRSRETLELIARNTKDRGGECPGIVPDAPAKSPSLAEKAAMYEAGRFSCEQLLATRALSHID